MARIRFLFNLLCCFVVVGLTIPLSPAAIADSPPGTDADSIGPSPVEFGSIIPVVTETGLISFSVDGLGTNNTGGGIIQVEKPAGATVRGAYMGAASTGFSRRVLADGDVRLDGNPVAWDLSTPSSIRSSNHWAGVTDIVKPKVDAAPPGRVDFDIAEVGTSGIDGEILAVIFDDPNQTTQNTVMLLFGAQNVLGDTFNIGLAEPLDLSDPNFAMDMSLGISYGYQTPFNANQFSRVDVNGTRLTSAAGGQDDGEPANGALLTVGGLDDSNDNPPDPFAPPADFNDPDDELYNLLPFLSNGDTGVQVNTINPSNDDNIFFAGFFVKSAVAIVGNGAHGANLVLSKQAPISKDRGSLITYSLHYHDLGDTSAQNVVLEDSLSGAVEFVSASDGGVYDANTRTVSWDIGNLVPFGHGEVSVTVRIPTSAAIGTLIQNEALISTSDPEVRYDDNEARTQTRVTGSNLPAGASVEPNNGGTTPSVYWRTPITFSYAAPASVIAVDIRIHINDGGPDIVGSMTGGPPEWTYTTTFYPRHGRTTVTYTVHEPTPYEVDFDVRSMRGFENTITAQEVRNYIEVNYPDSLLLDEPDIGQRFVDAGLQNSINPAFLVATAELEGRFASPGWNAWAYSHPEAHNTMGWGVPNPDTPVGPGNSFDSWGDGIEYVAERIAADDGIYFGHDTDPVFTVLDIRQRYVYGFLEDYPGDGGAAAIANFMNQLAEDANQAGEFDEDFNIYIDPAGYIYDTESGERIAGAIVWLQRPDGSGGWENVPTGQDPPVAQPDVNPQTTGEDGQYQWDVLAGSYRVHVEAPGYYPADSPVVSIPPPVTDLHVGLTPRPVTNIPPEAEAGGPYAGVEGSAVAFDASGSFDPDGSIALYEWDVDGDGTYDFSSSSPIIEYTYGDDFTGTVRLRVTDDEGLTNADTAEVIVVNVPTAVDAIMVPVEPVEVNTTINVQGNFTDPGFLDIHTAEWDWGDDTTSAGIVDEENGFGNVTGSHTYSDAGVYTITLTVTDDDGGVGTAEYQYVVVFDPEGGFVTGGGWIHSEAGAYAPDDTLEGKATFGFVSKYKKGATTPTGQTEFQFKVADLNFHSGSYDWLVIAGHRAVYKGTGTINGDGNYGFMLSAIDEALTPSKDIDLFRIKIWDRDDDDAVVYDNQMGDADGANPATEIGGGSIVVHKAKK